MAWSSSYFAPEKLGGRASLAVLSIVSVGLLAAGGGRDPLPYALALQVTAGEERVSEGLREDIERSILAELGARGCVREIRRSEPGAEPRADLLLKVSLDGIEEEIRYEPGIAELSSGSPDTLERYVARFHVTARLEILALRDSAPVWAKRVRVGADRRPMTRDEDVAAAARAQAVEQLTQEARRALCGGGRRKIQKKLEALSSSSSSELTRSR